MLLSEAEVAFVWQMRKALNMVDNAEATESLLDGMKLYPTNRQLVENGFKNTRDRRN